MGSPGVLKFFFNSRLTNRKPWKLELSRELHKRENVTLVKVNSDERLCTCMDLSVQAALGVLAKRVLGIGLG